MIKICYLQSPSLALNIGTWDQTADGFRDSLIDYTHHVPVSTSNIGSVSWPLYIENYYTFDHNFDINGCY